MEEEEDPGKPGKKVKDPVDIIKQEMSGASPVKLNTTVIQENCVTFKTTDVESSKTTNTESDPPATKKIKLDKDVSISDTAETIKKIQAFIALGKVEEPNKDVEVPEKSTVETISNINSDSPEKQQEAVESAKMNNINALQRTLQGLDDSQDNDLSEENKPTETLKDGSIENLATPLKEKTRDPRCGEGFIKINEMLTPSRVSKRIQSKTVKFSAKKLLRGDDSHLPKRKTPSYEKGKKVKRGIKKVKSGDDDDSLEAETSADEPLPLNKSESEKSLASGDAVSVSPSASNTSLKSQPVTKTQFVSPSSPVSKRPILQSESKDKSSLADKLGKFAVTNGKITLELKTAQKKKVVRIAVPPQTAPSPCTPASLGPDIIIKRVKPVKKTVVPETPKEQTKTFVEKELEQTSQRADIPQLIKMSPKMRIERIPVKKLKNDIVRIQKNIIKSGKPDESKVMAIKCVQVAKPDGSVSDSGDNSDHVEEDKAEEANSNKVKDTSNEEPSIIQEVTQLLDGSKAIHESRLGNSSHPGVSSNKDEVPAKKRGRKPRFAGDKAKSDYFSRKSERSRDFERSSPITDDELADPPDRSPTLFDRYFTTTERYAEHHDSLDSDSSDDFDNKIYSHFINLKKHNKKKEEASVYDIMQDISIELPTWNIHASSTGEIFYLVQVDSLNDRPSMKKVVALDLDSNAKVYVDDKLVPEYEGNYSSYEDIRQLIYDIDQM